MTSTRAFLTCHVHEASKPGKPCLVADFNAFHVPQFSIRYDINNDGDINLTELSYCLKALGFRVSIEQILATYDKNHDGTFDHNEFQVIVHDLDKAAQSRNQQNHRFQRLRNSTKKMHGLNVLNIDISSANNR